MVGTDGSRYYTFDLSDGTHVVGRRTDCEVCITDRTVSRRHAEITVSGDAITVVDLGSHNGTSVNGKPAQSPLNVDIGDVVTFGQAEFRVAGAGDAVEPPSTRQEIASFTDVDLEKSVVMSVSDFQQPLSTRVTAMPELLPTLSEMARMLVLPEPQEVMLERSLTLVARMIPAERLAVLIKSGDSVHPVATLLPGDKDPGGFQLSSTIVNEILNNKSAVLMGDPADDQRFAEQKSIIQLELKSAMAAPLLDEGEVLGILYVDSTNPVHLYNEDHLRLLATFGNIIASRMVNFALLEERQENELMQRELARAASIQRNLLVAEPPSVQGYSVFAYQEPCLTVGGDLYDYAILPDGRLFFLVGDVSGKGMGAAILMSNILASFRILEGTGEEVSLLEAVSQVSKQLWRFSAPSDFATLFVGVLNTRTHSLKFVNAGHNAPLLLRADGQQEWLQPSGTMIGAFDMMAWEESRTELQPNDLLVVYSDGVTEAEHDDEQYGEERMTKVVAAHPERSAEAHARGMITDILDFVGDSPRSDDITMLLVKRED